MGTIYKQGPGNHETRARARIYLFFYGLGLSIRIRFKKTFTRTWGTLTFRPHRNMWNKHQDFSTRKWISVSIPLSLITVSIPDRPEIRCSFLNHTIPTEQNWKPPTVRLRYLSVSKDRYFLRSSGHEHQKNFLSLRSWQVDQYPKLRGC